MSNTHTTDGKHGVEFLYPPPGLSPNYLDTINVTYTSPFPNPLLFTFCRNSSNPNDLVQERIDRVTPYNGTLSIILDYLNVSSCYFNLRPNSTAGNGANSDSIVLFPKARLPAPTVYGLQQAESTSTPSPIPETTPSPSPSASPSPTPAAIVSENNPKTSGLATGAIAGIVIGVGVLVGALIALIVYLIIKKRRQRSTAPSKPTLPDKGQDHINEVYSHSTYDPTISTPQIEGQENKYLISEMDISQPRTMELDSRIVIPELGPGQSRNGNYENRH